ncbi:Lectin C-type domain family protein [Acanthocheilonema viteae]
MYSYFICCNFSANFHFKHPFWIGLSNDGNEWKWPDGTKLRYQLWGDNEPNTIHSCVIAGTEMNGRYWHTNDCNNASLHSASIIGYVCQQ